MGTSIPVKDIGYWFDYDKELFVYKKNNEYFDEDNKQVSDITGFLEVKQDADKNFVIQFQNIDFKDKNLENLKKQLIECKYNKLWIYEDKFIVKKDKGNTFEESYDGKIYINSEIKDITIGLEVNYDYINKLFVVTKDNHTIVGKNILELKRNIKILEDIIEKIKKLFKGMIYIGISDIEINAILLNPVILNMPMSSKSKNFIISKLNEKRDFELRKAEIEKFYKKYKNYVDNIRISTKMTSLEKIKYHDNTRKLQKLCTIEDRSTQPRVNNRKYRPSDFVSIDIKYENIKACRDALDRYVKPRNIKKVIKVFATKKSKPKKSSLPQK